MADINTAIDGDPSNYCFRYYRGTIYMHMEEYTAAIEDFKSSMVAGERHTNKARLLRATCNARLGRTPESLSDLKRLTQIDPSSPNGWMALGLALMELGRHGEAIDLFGTAAERAYNNPLLASKALDNKAWAEFHTGRFKRALETLSVAISTAGDERAADPSPLLHRGAILLGMRGAGQQLKALPDLVRAADLMEALTRKEARKDARDTVDGGAGANGLAGTSRSESPMNGTSNTITATTTAMSPTGRKGKANKAGGGGGAGGGMSRDFDILPPEAAAALGEAGPGSSAMPGSPLPPGAMSVTGGGSSMVSGQFGFGPQQTTSGGSTLGGGGAGSMLGAPDDADTDSDTYSDAVREHDMTVAELQRKKKSETSDANNKNAAAAATGGSPSKKSASTPSATAAATAGDSKKGDDDDNKSDQGSVRSGATAAGRGSRRTPTARNLGRSTGSRRSAASGSTLQKPWAVVPPWAKDRPWPEQPGAFTIPHSRVLCAAAAHVQAYLGLCYEQLGLFERALHHFGNAMAAWPAFVPAQYHAALCLHRTGRHGEADHLLTTVLRQTEGITDEVEVVPPNQQHQGNTTGQQQQQQPVPGQSSLASSSHHASGGPGPAPSPCEALWSPATSRSAIVRLGISSIELVAEWHPEEAPADSPRAAVSLSPTAGDAGGLSEEKKDDPAAPSVAAAIAESATGLADDSLGSSRSFDHSASPRGEALATAVHRRARAKVLLARGLAIQAQGRHDAATDDLVASISADGGVGEAYYHRAVSGIATGRAKQAVRDCRTAISLGYDGASVRDLLGQGFLHLGQYQEAVAQLTSALKAQPESPMYLSRRADAHRALGNPQQAIMDITAALMVADKEVVPDLLSQRASCHWDQNDWDSAIADYKAALAAEHISRAFQARLRYSAGLCYANSDRYADAVECFDTSIHLLVPLCGPRKRQGGSGDDADDEGGFDGADDGVSRDRGDEVVNGMSNKLAAALATAGMRVEAPKLRNYDEDYDDDNGDADGGQQSDGGGAGSKRGAGSGAAGLFRVDKSADRVALPLSGGVGAALRGLAASKPAGKGADSGNVKGMMGKWAQKGKAATTHGVTAAELAAATRAAADAGSFGAGGASSSIDGAQLTLHPVSRARERYLARLSHANAHAPPDLVRLRVSSIHERAKARQMLGLHRDAAADFTETLASCPTHAHAIFRRAISYKCLGEFTAAADDFENSKLLARPDLRPSISLNYNSIADVSAVVLCGAGEEPEYPVLGLDDGGIAAALAAIRIR